MAYDIAESIGFQPLLYIITKQLICCVWFIIDNAMNANCMYIRFEPVDKEMMIAVAQAEYLAQQVRVNRVSRRTAKQRTLEQNEKGPNVVL